MHGLFLDKTRKEERRNIVDAFQSILNDSKRKLKKYVLIKAVNCVKSLLKMVT